AGRPRSHGENPAASGPLPVLPQLRDDLPFRPRSADAHARRLRAAGFVAEYQCGHGASTRPPRHQHCLDRPGRVLRRGGLPLECPGTGLAARPSQHRCMVAQRASRCGSDRADSQRLRRLRQGLRSPAARRSGLCTKSRRDQRAHQRPGGNSARRTAGTAWRLHPPDPGLPLPVYAAARTEAWRRRRIGTDSAGLQPYTGARQSLMLWLGGYLLGHPARVGNAVARQQDERAGKRQPGRHRDGQHWLPDAPGQRQPHAGDALDRTRRGRAAS
nr:hypothetical protein [Tanacetum cinerariifolium]